MNVQIKSMDIENFKGIRSKHVDFSDKTTISGRNASGKSTVASAYFWVLADKDINLVSNPKIQPLGVEECSPTVSVTLEVEGKPVTLTKMQKTKKSKADDEGVVKISLSNSYEINSVPKTERDFKAYLEELQLPALDSILMCSHTEVFSNMKPADARKLLFEMATDHTDLEIATKLGTVPLVVNLLENYTVEEITAMQKASIKKCDEQIKNIPGQIEGLELAKTDNEDIAEFELAKTSINLEIDKCQELLSEHNSYKEQYSHLCVESLRLDFEKNAEITKMNESANEGKKELGDKVVEAHNQLVDIKDVINRIDRDIKYTESKISDEKDEFTRLKETYNSAKALKFDASKNICPCCGQEYPEDKKAEFKANFEADKKQKMDEANHSAAKVKARISSLESDLQGSTQNYTKAKEKLAELEKSYKEFSDAFDNFKPSEPVKTERLIEIEKLIEENNAKKNALPKDTDQIISDCNIKIRDFRNQLDEINKKIGASSNNIRIDEQIEELSAKRTEYEQTKADAEKILYQVELLSKAKNEQLADDINSHFKKVRFQFFKYLKNSNYKECCEAYTLDGKEMGVSTNTALEVEMKLDICRGLQKFYDVDLPIFCDNSECLDSENANKINLGTQMIFLKVTDDDLKIGE